ncbi:ATP-dependent protease [Xinfangfangia sp. D13-10-4-6]|uniref:LON peptidase substrate-binding domain-containing protein n=1 Tax=Pseudogemmobacter hezensis TaxID=2737662 RepID=UPI001556D7D4|nr:LON peptidase substrate-binding domain-containing protein [Pseudogemmobacter hezensis]NPD13989.1 ATP-dependent protease [Pseudogemmobacter hezensis]
MFPRHPSLSDLPGTIPVFPLPGALLLPRARLPLHIFEPRYLAMIDDCLKHPHRLIGMVCPLGEEGDRLSAIGCAGRLVQLSETEDRRYMITLSGVARFRLQAEVEGFTPYRRFNVDWSSFGRDLGTTELDPGLDRPALFALVSRYLAGRDMSADWKGLESAPDEVLINALSMLVPLPPEDRQALLESPDLPTRRETLVTLVEFALRGGNSDEILQ